MWPLLLISLGLVALFVILYLSLKSLILASLSGAPFVPARADRIETLINFTQPLSGKRMVDLGSGDGRLVRALAKHGAIVDGYEIQWPLVIWSKFLSRLQSLPHTKYFHQNLFMADLSDYQIVVMYALPNMMPKLRQKFENELKPGIYVASIVFPIPGWSALKESNRVYLYQIGKVKEQSK